ncbi:MAG: DUF4062 domain-containing protein [Fusobacteriaceae bacterium]
MPAPRIFISSTCFDLQEIRGNIRQFIRDFGYDPIMSEFGDIFYDFDAHVQDSCIEGIKSSDFYILIIGDYYGSLYHKANSKKPDSVTLKEFSNALNLDKPKMIFINKFVEYDYRNYRRFLDNKYKEEFSKNEEKIILEKIESKKQEVKEQFDKSYPFPKDSYRFIFYFLDKINDLEVGNAYHKFETSFEIKDILKKQWASYFQECLTKRKEADEKQELKKISEKIENIYKLMSSLSNELNEKEEGEFSTFISTVKSSAFEEEKKILANLNKNLFYTEDFNLQRIEFNQKLTSEDIKKMLESFDELLNEYKWSTKIPITSVFKRTTSLYKFWEDREDVPYNTILNFNKLFKSVKDEESFLNCIAMDANKLFKKSYPSPNNDEDDFPF